MQKYGVDISTHQNSSAAQDVLDGGIIDFVIPRVSVGSASIDTNFATYMQALNEKTNLGFYSANYFYSEEDARIEANYLIDVIESYGITSKTIQLPIFQDWEEFSYEWNVTQGRTITPSQLQLMSDAWIQAVQDRGYVAGIYCNKNFYDNWYTQSHFDKHTDVWVWLADPSYPDSPQRPCQIHQYAVEDGSDFGYSGNIDKNKLFVEYLNQNTPIEIQKAKFFMEYMRVTQGSYVGSHLGSLALDFGGKDTGIDKLYCPCDMKVIRTRQNANGELYLESLEPVELADGTVDYLRLIFIHDSEFNVVEGQILQQGDYFYDEGGMGSGNPSAFAIHVHVEGGKGKWISATQSQNAQGVYVIENQSPLNELLYVGDDVIILDDGGLEWVIDTPILPRDNIGVKMGFATGGDLATLETLLDDMKIIYSTVDGIITTLNTNSIERETLKQKCEELIIPYQEYIINGGKMSLNKSIQTTVANIDTIPIVDGQFIIATDDVNGGKIFKDDADKRHLISSTEVLDNSITLEKLSENVQNNNIIGNYEQLGNVLTGKGLNGKFKATDSKNYKEFIVNGVAYTVLIAPIIFGATKSLSLLEDMEYFFMLNEVDKTISFPNITRSEQLWTNSDQTSFLPQTINISNLNRFASLQVIMVALPANEPPVFITQSMTLQTLDLQALSTTVFAPSGANKYDITRFASLTSNSVSFTNALVSVDNTALIVDNTKAIPVQIWGIY